MSSLLGEVDASPDVDIRSATFEQLERMAHRGELPAPRGDADEIALDNSFWNEAKRMRVLPRKASVHLRVDQDVLDWFKAQGKGHLTRMNAVLRTYVHAKLAAQARPAKSGKQKPRKRAAAQMRTYRKTERP